MQICYDKVALGLNKADINEDNISVKIAEQFVVEG